MRISRNFIGAVLLTLGCLSVFADTTGEPAPSRSSWLGEPDFWIATAANVAGIGLFIARVHRPEASPVFGYATEALGIPALAVGVIDLATGTADAATAGMLTYAGWALGAAFVDHVLDLNYRDPVRLGILVPYVVAYYAGIGVLSATQLVNGTPPWLIAGGTCLLAVGASFYARAMGAD